MIRYKEVWEGKDAEIVEKKSRFIAHVKAVYSVEEAQEFIEQMKKKYWDARHNCSAFSVGVEHPVTRCSDDGEPGGTAGKPILEVILGSGILNVAIVVTRYFGGTLLGTGGLVRAYTKAAQEGLSSSLIIEKIPGRTMDLYMDYTDLGKVQYVLAKNNAYTQDTVYSDKVALKVIAALDSYEALHKSLIQATSARIRITEGKEVYFAAVQGEILTF